MIVKSSPNMYQYTSHNTGNYEIITIILMTSLN